MRDGNPWFRGYCALSDTAYCLRVQNYANNSKTPNVTIDILLKWVEIYAQMVFLLVDEYKKGRII